MAGKNLRTAVVLASVAVVLCLGFAARFWLFGQ